MKKSTSNLITFLTFITVIAVLILFMVFQHFTADSDHPKETDRLFPSETITESVETTAAPSKKKQKSQKASAVSNQQKTDMKDALFIGDSRTLGLFEYAGIKEADFFSNVGMSVYNIHKDTVSVPSVGKVTLHELLSHKQYGKIYIMMGINELGYNFDQTVSRYQELIDFIQEKQPDAIIFMEANLHVTKNRSDTDKVVNNTAINRFNTALSKFADNETIFYLDVNTLFDDAGGNLSADKSEDSTHLYAKYYAQWGQWIINQSNVPVRRNDFDRKR